MLAKFSARQPPDVFYLTAENFADWVRQGRASQPLDSYIVEDQVQREAVLPRLAESFKFEGARLRLPKDWSSLGMEVNTQLLARVGGKAPKTWAQLRSLAQEAEPLMTGRQADLSVGGLAAGAACSSTRPRAVIRRTATRSSHLRLSGRR